MQGGWTNTNAEATHRFWKEFTELSAIARHVREAEEAIQRNQQIKEEMAAIEEARSECLVERQEEENRV